MNDIAIAVQQLASAIEDQPDEVRIWAAASFAGHLGLAAIISANDDPVEAIVEIGEMWADSVAELLEDQPRRRGDILRAAHRAVQRLLDVVQRVRFMRSRAEREGVGANVMPS